MWAFNSYCAWVVKDDEGEEKKMKKKKNNNNNNNTYTGLSPTRAKIKVISGEACCRAASTTGSAEKHVFAKTHS